MSGQVWFYLAPDVRYGITFLLISSMDYIYVRYELTKCVCQVSWWVYLVYFLISGMTLPVFYVRYEFTCIFMSGMSLPVFFFLSGMHGMSLPVFFVRYGITLFHSVEMLLPPPPCLFRRTSMRDWMSWSPSWAPLTACISSEESVMESSKSHRLIYTHASDV